MVTRPLPLQQISRAPNSVQDLLDQLPSVASRAWLMRPDPASDEALRDDEGRDVVCAMVHAANPGIDFKQSAIRAIEALLGAELTPEQRRVVRSFVVSCEMPIGRLRDQAARDVRTQIIQALSPARRP